MSNSAIPVNSGTGPNVDTWVPSGGDHQQIVVFRAYPAATATLTSPSIATTSTTVLAANLNRLGVVVFNESATDLYLKFGSAASTTSYTDRIPPGAPWYYPEGGAPMYTGIITAVSGSGTVTVRVTELTP